ncbi:fasciclin domain-containing protein [Nonlabens sp. Ci31]|jgi:uncharacterized surface protein with fasciclin (FAS1) repeats|uniref:fasciclin domain-containing protein n=1 Tax=Nonlabens sp. Ci31 TaxID=2608253 RepID=UPI001462EF90|nr:fasciclin domain-containing protein [Nonlabens sp. Ci31]QJP33582.1 fasciclin domain-containing protein [Nonlabens sp. Ci31]
MKKSRVLSLALLAVALFVGHSSFAQNDKMMKKEKTVMVGGSEMYPSKNIIENAAHSKDHTTLVAAVKAADLVKVLSGEGPFTVFAPTNGAFDKLPEGTVPTLLKPENKAALTGVLTYHVIAGKFNATDVIELIRKNDGKATVKTVAGSEITLSLQDGKVIITDANGGMATVTIADVNQSNGVIHVIDMVLLPKM